MVIKTVPISIAIALVAGASPLNAQCEQSEITPQGLLATQDYGRSSSASDERVVVGSSGLFFREEVYVYNISGRNWFLEQMIPSPLGSAKTFGVSVSLDGNRLAVGSSSYSPTVSQQGALVMFEFDGQTWNLQQTLVANNPNPTARLGGSVDLKGDRLVVGAPNDDTLASFAGAAFVFDFDGIAWVQSAKLLASDGQASDFFGDTVSLFNDRIVAGANRSDPGGLSNGGAAYVFELIGSSWVETAKIVPGDVLQSSQFGAVVDLQDDLLFASSRDSTLGGTAGAVYVFQYISGTWAQTQKLFASDGFTADEFGIAIDSDGVTLAIGAQGETSDRGAAYIFRDLGSGWVETGKITASNVEDDDMFGSSIGVDGDVLVVGSFQADANGLDTTGKAYCFSVDSLLCQSLGVNSSTLSLSQGGTAAMTLLPGPAEAGSNYWVLGSISGNEPGFPLGGLQVPLNIDDYFTLSLLPNPSSPLLNSVGTINNMGLASAFLSLPPLSDPTLVGLTVEHAFVLYDLGPLTISHVSSPVSILLEQ